MTQRGVSPGRMRAGILGAGLMGRWHAQAVDSVGGQVVAIIDPDHAAAAALAARHPQAEVLASYETGFDRRLLDVLHVCTPTATHAQIAAAAVHAGVHVLIEKPMTATATETESLLDAAGLRGVLVCPVHQFLFQDGVRRALAHLPDLGKVVHLQATFCSTGGGSTDTEELDGIVADILPHPLSLMQRFLSHDLPARGWATLHASAGELRATAQAAEATLAIFVSMSARPTVCAFDVLGTEGTIHMDLYHGYTVIEHGTGGRAHKIVHPFARSLKTLGAATVNLTQRAIRWEPAYPGLRSLMAAFYDAARQGRASPIAPADVLTVARVRDLLIADAGIAATKTPSRGSRTA